MAAGLGSLRFSGYVQEAAVQAVGHARARQQPLRLGRVLGGQLEVGHPDRSTTQELHVDLSWLTLPGS